MEAPMLRGAAFTLTVLLTLSLMTVPATAFHDAADATADGDAEARFVAASATGNATCTGERCVAASGTGTADACSTSNAFEFPWTHTCAAASGVGSATGQLAASGAGTATGVLAVSVAGPAHGSSCTVLICWPGAGVSGTGDASGVWAVSVMGDAEGVFVAVSGTGHADGWFPVSACDTDEALCHDAPALLP